MTFQSVAEGCHDGRARRDERGTVERDGIGEAGGSLELEDAADVVRGGLWV